MERDVEETLAHYNARLEAVGDVSNKFTNGILIGRNVSIPYLLDGESKQIKKIPIGWPLANYNMFYTVDVPEDTFIKPHSHDEDIFRLLIDGDLTINGVSIEKGEWFVVKAGTTYSIQTKNGYKSFAGYGMACQTQTSNFMHVEKTPD